MNHDAVVNCNVITSGDVSTKLFQNFFKFKKFLRFTVLEKNLQNL